MGPAPILTFILLFCSVLNAELSSPLTFIKVPRSDKKGAVQLLGRVVPNLGSLQVERVEHRTKIISILSPEGSHVKVGTPLIRVTGSVCKNPNSTCLLSAHSEGVVSETLKQVGQTLEEGEAFANILNSSATSIQVDLPKQYLPYLAIGQSLKAWLSRRPSKKIETRVVEISPSLGGAEHSRTVRLSVSQVPAGLQLDSILNVEMEIPLALGSWRVPAAAVAFYGNQHYILKKREPKLEAVAVEVLSDAGDDLWVRPVSNRSIVEGDLILADRAIFYLTHALEKEAE